MFVRSNVIAADTTWIPHSASVVNECPVLLLNAFMMFASSVVCGEAASGLGKREECRKKDCGVGSRCLYMSRRQFVVTRRPGLVGF
jgi:hypothetical protein